MKFHALADVVAYSNLSFTCPVFFHIYERILDIALIPALIGGDSLLDIPIDILPPVLVL